MTGYCRRRSNILLVLRVTITTAVVVSARGWGAYMPLLGGRYAVQNVRDSFALVDRRREQLA